MRKRLLSILLTACMVLSLLPGFTQTVMAAYSPTIYITLDGQPMSTAAIVSVDPILFAYTMKNTSIIASQFEERTTGTFTISNIADGAYTLAIGSMRGFTDINYRLIDYHLMVDQSPFTISNTTSYPLTLVFYSVSYKSGTNAKETSASWMHIAAKDRGQYTRSSYLYTRDGYKQIGWSTDQNGTAKTYDLGAVIYPTAPMALYPAWGKLCAVTITDGAGVSSTKTSAAGSVTGSITSGTSAVEGETVTVTPGIPAIGYKLSAVKYNDGTDRVLTKSGGKYTFTMPAAAVSISTEYVPDTFAVTYNPGTNGTGSQQTTTKTGGTALTLKSAIFTRAGYDQTGWAITDGGAKAYELGDSYTINAAKDFYPVWTANTYNISYTLNGGTASANPGSYTIESNTITLTNPTRTGYTLVGWTGSNGETAQTSVTISAGSTGNKSYTANWKAEAPSAPSASIVTAKTDKSLTITTAAGYEYSVNGTNWYSGAGSYTFTGLTAGTAYNLICRKAAVTTGNVSAASDASEALSVCTKNGAPSTPAASISGVTANSVTLLPVTGGEYSKDGGSSWQNSNAFAGLSAATKYNFAVRIKETSDTMASAASTTVPQYTAAAAPSTGVGYTVSYSAETISITSGYEVSSDSSFASDKLLSNEAAITPGTTYYVRVKAIVGGAPASEAVSFTVAARPTAPAAILPANITRTDTVITILNTISTQEYSVDGTNWQTGTDGNLSFNSLTANQDYSVMTRIPPSAVSFASTPSDTLAVTTKTASAALSDSGVTYSVKDGTLTGLGSIYEYSLDNGATWQTSPVTGVTFTAGNIIQVRTRETDDAMPSLPQTLGTIDALKAAPSYAVDFASETTTDSVPVKVEYNTSSATATTWTAGQGTALPLTPGTTYYFREAATDAALAGNVQTLSVSARPSAPADTVAAIAAGDDSSHTNLTLTAIHEYLFAASVPGISESGTAGTASATEVAAAAGQNVYVRVKATISAFASNWTDCGKVLLGVDSIALTDVGYNVATRTLTGTTTNMEYSLDGAAWQDCTADNTTGLTFVAGTVKVRQKDKPTNEHTVGTIAPVESSADPTLGSKTYNSVTLTAMTGYEYSRDGGTTWQDSNVFSGLNSSTTYSFSARIKATAATLPGTVSAALTVMTNSVPTAGGSTIVPAVTPDSTPDDDESTIVPTGAPVIVDGKTVNIGTANTSGGTTTVTVDQSKLSTNIDSASSGSSVVVPVGETSTAAASLVVKNIEDMAAKGMTLTVQTGKVAYNLNTSAIDTAALTEAFPGADMSKVPFDVTIQNSSVSVTGETLVASPVAFTVTATYNGKTVSVDTFSAYIDRAIEVTAEQASKITTAVVVNSDGSTRHVPTNVIEKDGKYYAVINSRTNSTYALIQNEVTFADAQGKWYEAAVNEMGSRKIVTGRSASVFDGVASITRAEFAVILVRALGLPADGRSTFSDVPSTAWYTGAVATAAQYGLVVGKGKNHFDPNAAITRQEAMLILQRTAALTEFSGASVALDGFSDTDSIGSWAKDAVKWNVGSGLIQGADGKLNPTASITRAESAAIILRLLQKSGLVDIRS